ncbi:COG4705 Uncharacterized membrane-anchored protein conserved in bacteria [Candidatus Nanopelagicaceae bacterium]|jgi:uncharacterized membrane-anchored protein
MEKLAQRPSGMLVKVPEITMYFWIIKVLATTVGETFADFLNTNLGLGLSGTSIATFIALAIVLFFQFNGKGYKPPVYWLAIVLISIAGTLVTDNLTDNVGISLITSSIIFSICLAAVFAVWYAKEKTLAIHSIHTPTREAFYWLTILFTFALGTATGDLFAERLALGYARSLFVFAALIALIAILWQKKVINAVFGFWAVYVLTRPLGASIGDLLSQDKKVGGFGLGTTVTSLIFLTLITITVTYLVRTEKDQITTIAN